MSSVFSTELKVGITTFLAILILFGGVLWIKKYNPMVKKVRIAVVFTNAKGIAPGDPVHLAGIKIGEIKNVKLNELNEAQVEFYVPHYLNLKFGSIFTIEDVGLMGDKALAIIPGDGKDTLDPTIIHMGLEGFDYKALLANADTIMQKLTSISTKLDNDIDIAKLAVTFEQTLQKFHETLDIYDEIARENRKPLNNSITAIETSSNEFKQLIRKNDENLSSAFDSFQHISEKLSSAIDKLDNISTVVDTLSVYMESGEGTFAKLVKSDDLYNELRTTNAHLDSFITDFRLNPGKYTRDMKFKIGLF
ncbi:MlaD family protein [Candidatus Latescibacterota bacterium]